MKDTSGPRGSGSSARTSLQPFLESRLPRRMASLGSKLFKLTWKMRVMKSGVRIFALRASVLRTSARAFSSWPSPTANDAKGSDYSYGGGRHDRPCLKLGGVAKLASWATPVAHEAGGTPEAFLERKRKAIAQGKKLGVSLTSLSLQVQLADSGKARSGSRASMKSGGRLNPNLSRWLMGLPVEWDLCAPRRGRSSSTKKKEHRGSEATATRLSRRSRPSSSRA
jgi:hypothetical protein